MDRHQLTRRVAPGVLLAACLVVPATSTPAQAAVACPEGLHNIAHRGPHATRDENTISSIVQAGENGIELELDVRQDAQGEEWLHHDATLDRTTNGTGLFYTKSTAHIASLRTEPRGQEIPTFVEAMTAAAAYPSIEAIYLDLWSKNPTDAFVNDVVDGIEEAGLTDRTYIVKFHARVARLAPHVLRQWKPPAGTTLQQMLNKRVESIAAPQGMMSAELVQQLHDGGVEDVVMMSVNTENSLRTAVAKGVDGVMGDSPFFIISQCGW